MKKFIITAELRELERQVSTGVITYSRMIEKLNEKAEKWHKAKLKNRTLFGIVGSFACYIGLHKWKEIYTGSLITPCGDECQRCDTVRVFRLFGYTYHKRQ